MKLSMYVPAVPAAGLPDSTPVAALNVTPTAGADDQGEKKDGK